ncbi:MAG: hypothetical protein D6798_14055, partial [Deltaproteobacteria bacterium]
TAIQDVQTGVVAEGETVTLRGLVAEGSSSTGFFLLDPAGGSYSGIWIYTSSGWGGAVVYRGDEVEVTGTVSEYTPGGSSGTLTELIVDRSADLTVLSSGHSLPEPNLLSLGAFTSDSSLEPYESTLVRVEGLTVTDADVGYGSFECDSLVIVDDYYYDVPVSLGDTFEAIQGPLTYSYDEFRILPRDADDIEGHGGPSDCDASLCVGDLVAGDLVITEVMINPNAGDDESNEWIEVYNAAGATVDLYGLVLGDSGSSSGVIADTVVVSPGDRVVLARGDGSGWAYPFTPAAWWGSSPALGNSGDLVSVGNSDGIIDETATWSAGDADAGIAWQLAPRYTDAVSNDSDTAWCGASTAIGTTGDRGTPGSVNTGC